MKPFLYYAAFERAGLSPASVFVDRKVTIPLPGQPAWAPRNFSGDYEGPMILKRALSRSVNSIAAQLVEQTGAQAVIDAARRCGIKSPLAAVPSVALGTSGVSPLEMASAFATLATGGMQHDPYWTRRVEDSCGRILEERIVSGRRTLDASIAFQLVDMMRAVLADGYRREFPPGHAARPAGSADSGRVPARADGGGHRVGGGLRGAGLRRRLCDLVPRAAATERDPRGHASAGGSSDGAGGPGW